MDLAKVVLIVLIVFFLGWTTNSAYTGFTTASSVNGVNLFTNSEKLSPQDHIEENDIRVYEDKVIIEKPGMMWSRFMDTNSMDPLLDQGANGLEIKPKSHSEINVGDVISYRYGEDLIVHRVIEIGVDSKGWYAIAKGDNNPTKDPKKIRFSDIHGIVVGVIY